MGKKKPPPEKKELTAPFYMLTYGDMMTLLLCFFILLFAMSTLEVTKFQAQVSVMQGSMGISKLYQHAPMQQNMPSPAVKVSTRVVTKADTTPAETRTSSDYVVVGAADSIKEEEKDRLQAIRTLGLKADFSIITEPNEVILVLPTYGVFNKGEYIIDPASSEVQALRRVYGELARQVALLPDYDVHFIGHTDNMPLLPREGDGPKNNTELGFMRAFALYNFFFSKQLQDQTRITFGSQGDNVPVIPDASLDSEHRKNRRVEVHLKRKRASAGNG